MSPGHQRIRKEKRPQCRQGRESVRKSRAQGVDWGRQRRRRTMGVMAKGTNYYCKLKHPTKCPQLPSPVAQQLRRATGISHTTKVPLYPTISYHHSILLLLLYTTFVLDPSNLINPSPDSSIQHGSLRLQFQLIRPTTGCQKRHHQASANRSRHHQRPRLDQRTSFPSNPLDPSRS